MPSSVNWVFYRRNLVRNTKNKIEYNLKTIYSPINHIIAKQCLI